MKDKIRTLYKDVGRLLDSRLKSADLNIDEMDETITTIKILRHMVEDMFVKQIEGRALKCRNIKGLCICGRPIYEQRKEFCEECSENEQSYM